MRRRDFVRAISVPALAWPFAVRAQQISLPAIGFMSSRSPEDSASVIAAFRAGLNLATADE
jgi:putative ABC transport system substrate-binding protein